MRRKRITWTSKQKKKLEENYAREQYPTVLEIQSLALELGRVGEQVVKTWFRNRRKGSFPMNKNNRKIKDFATDRAILMKVSEYEAKVAMKSKPDVAQNRNDNLTNQTSSNSSSDNSGYFSFQLLEASQNELDDREIFSQGDFNDDSRVEEPNSETFMEMLMDSGNQLVTHLYAL
uniref:Homeobox domain-containing protein n=1 Tax=Oikopleura dioica TaxID=34765 RepID=Q675W3_OIKDI|nr:hypothetical protein 004-06 [Oikopleura dioica]